MLNMPFCTILLSHLYDFVSFFWAYNNSSPHNADNNNMLYHHYIREQCDSSTPASNAVH